MNMSLQQRYASPIGRLIIAAVALLTIYTHTLKATEAIPDMSKDTIIVMETTQGNIEIKLMPEAAPKAVENFLKLAEKQYYDGLTFHRVIKGFMIQGGDPNGNGTGGQSIWGKPFEDEFQGSATFNKAGILAMANAGPNTNGSQFFITVAPTPWLNKKHTIFGEVISGEDVLKKLENSPVDPRDRPTPPQKIIKVYPKKVSQPSSSATKAAN